jgi:hypothetical protein
MEHKKNQKIIKISRKSKKKNQKIWKNQKI